MGGKDLFSWVFCAMSSGFKLILSTDSAIITHIYSYVKIDYETLREKEHCFSLIIFCVCAMSNAIL